VPSPFTEHFDNLRSLLELEQAKASLILVTSAKRGDGTDLLAHGLAEALASSGQATALVDASGAAVPIASGDRRPRDGSVVPHRRGPAMSMIALAPDESSADVTAFAATLRERFRYAVIDGGALPQNELAAMLAGLADTLILAVRKGRMASREDDVLLSVVDGARRPVLGIVTVEPKAIASFTSRASEFAPSTELVPLRHAVANV